MSLSAVAVVVALLLAGYLTRFMLSVAARSLAGQEHLPKAPSLSPFKSTSAIFRVLGVFLLYAAPAVTIPLLPLGLLALGYAEDGRAFNIFWAARAAARKSRELAILWMVILLWLAGLALLVAVTLAISEKVEGLVPSGQGVNGALMQAAVSVGTGAVIVTAVCLLSGVAFRCIGLFGRENPSLLRELPATSWATEIGVTLGLVMIVAVLAARWVWLQMNA
jgi:hypothetical protein